MNKHVMDDRGPVGRNDGWMNERWTFQHLCWNSQELPAKWKGDGGPGGFGRRVKESGSNGQQAQALAGLILVKGSVCVCVK